MENQNEYITKMRDGYMPHEHTKLDELKELDRKVKLFPTAFACAFGTVATLVFGTGMCLAMKVIGASLMSPQALMAVGVIIGCVGAALCAANYFIYNAMLSARKKKYGSRILALSNQLLNGEVNTEGKSDTL